MVFLLYLLKINTGQSWIHELILRKTVWNTWKSSKMNVISNFFIFPFFFFSPCITQNIVRILYNPFSCAVTKFYCNHSFSPREKERQEILNHLHSEYMSKFFSNSWISCCTTYIVSLLKLLLLLHNKYKTSFSLSLSVPVFLCFFLYLISLKTLQRFSRFNL